MSLRIPVTDDDYRALGTADVLDILTAIDVAEENGDNTAAESYYGILDLIIQKSSLLNNSEVILNTILEWLLRIDRVLPPQYNALKNFRNLLYFLSNQSPLFILSFNNGRYRT